MQVLALIEGVDQPCYRYRLEAFAWSMAQQGLYLQASPLRKGARAADRPNCGPPGGPRW